MKIRENIPVLGRSLTRRQSMVGVALAVGGLVVGTKSALAAPDDGTSHTAEAIHQEALIAASPQRIFDALMDAAQFQKVQLLGGAMKASDLIAKPAEISRDPGGAFSLFGGYIFGRQIELGPVNTIAVLQRRVRSTGKP